MPLRRQHRCSHAAHAACGFAGNRARRRLSAQSLASPHERPAPHRLPDRGADRDAVRARRAGPHRRHQRLHRASAAIARREKPKVSAFTSAKIDEILKLQPDFVDRLLRHPGRHRRRADPARRRGVDQQPPQRRGHPRLRAPARRAGRRAASARMPTPTNCSADSTAIAREAAALPRRPRVYFEEWDEPRDHRHPLGGRTGAHRRRRRRVPRARRRVAGASSASSRIRREVVRRAPDIILGSWCGKKFRPGEGRRAPGLGGDSRGARRRAARDQVAADPAAGAGGVDRGRARDRARSCAGRGRSRPPM